MMQGVFQWIDNLSGLASILIFVFILIVVQLLKTFCLNGLPRLNRASITSFSPGHVFRNFFL